MNLHRLLIGTTLLAAGFIATPAAGQPAAAALEPERVSLITKDGVQLTLAHYPSLERKGTPAAKQVTPVVLLHDFKDTRAIFGSLAARLQATGENQSKNSLFDVIAIDLRGHGDSTKQLLPNGVQQELDAAKLNPAGMAGMVSFDMETVRSWLVGKNDDGALNLNKLCLVGAGMGASVAVNWAAHDWAAPPLATGKQGQDVKALVLISPRWSYRGLTIQAPMQLPALKQNAAWMLIYGAEDAEFRTDARRIHDQLARFHPEVRGEGASGLISLAWPTKLQGGKLLSQNGPAIEDQIVKFLTTQVAERELPWLSRRDRLP
jgi:pimeloyl-ACP methyl ester carboxylesterase